VVVVVVLKCYPIHWRLSYYLSRSLYQKNALSVETERERERMALPWQMEFFFSSLPSFWFNIDSHFSRGFLSSLSFSTYLGCIWASQIHNPVCISSLSLLSFFSSIWINLQTSPFLVLSHKIHGIFKVLHSFLSLSSISHDDYKLIHCVCTSVGGTLSE